LHHYLQAGDSSIEMITVLLRHGARLNNVGQEGNSPPAYTFKDLIWETERKLVVSFYNTALTLSRLAKEAKI
jgi:hypothetical protein